MKESATTPRSREEVEGLEAFKNDSIPPSLKTYGGIDKIWLLPRNHPFNLTGTFQKHDQRYDLAKAGLIKSKSSLETDLLLWEDMVRDANKVWPGWSKKRLMRDAKWCYRISRLYGIFFWPKAAQN